MRNDHDSGYKFLFSTPELVRDLILGFVPDEWLHSLDYRTLEIVPGSYVTEDLSKRSDDIVWRVKVGGEWVYLYLLIEFQSGVDKYMALRMMVYVGLLYQALIKQGQLLSDDRLPPVLPIVLYNGSPRWTAATDVFHLIPPVPGLVEQFKPRFSYLLVDENAYTDGAKTSSGLRASSTRSSQVSISSRDAASKREARSGGSTSKRLASRRCRAMASPFSSPLAS